MSQRQLSIAVVALFIAACSPAQEPSSGEVEKEVQETMRRVQTGEKVTATRDGLDPCKILESGLVTEVFAVAAGAIQFRPGSSRHALCTATWRKSNADEIQANSGQQMMDYMKRKMAAQSKGEPFDEKMPNARPEATASLTIADTSFATSAEAVRSLESTVAMLKKGKTVEVQGKPYTTQVDYDDWMAGVGDRAAWAPKLSELSVAAGGVVFHVSVQVSDDAAANQARAIELARRIAAAL